MTIRVGINGFGRIGRNFWRAARKNASDIEIVAVNDLGNKATMAHLLKYDSVLGVLPDTIEATDDGISINGKTLKVLSERDPKNLPWKAHGVDVVIECGLGMNRTSNTVSTSSGRPCLKPNDITDTCSVSGRSSNENNSVIWVLNWAICRALVSMTLSANSRTGSSRSRSCSMASDTVPVSVRSG
ncbi:MAG: hypothetical protein EBW53_02800 [Actinobacteria bacterium]|nr:hypothetical protein [Actinomycetota bacterium]